MVPGHRQDAPDHGRQTLPRFGLPRELCAAAPRNLVIPGPPVVLRRAPRARDPAAVLQPEQRGVDGPLVQHDGVPADLLDAPRDAVSVLRSHRGERLQDHQVQRPLQEIQFWILWHGHRSLAHAVWDVHRRRSAPVLPREGVMSRFRKWTSSVRAALENHPRLLATSIVLMALALATGAAAVGWICHDAAV